MPSFVRSSRSYSFPPCIDNVEFAPHSEDSLPDIDEDPFSHFLTPVVEEDDPYDGLSMSAGIYVPDGPRTSRSSKFKSNVADKWARYVKHNHTQLHHQYHDSEPGDDDDDSFMTLDDDRLLDTPHTVSQLSTPPSPPPRIIIVEPTRGRAQELTSTPVRPRLRNSRTLSGHRHSWREPSPDLFTVEESEEDHVPTSRRSKSRAKKNTDHTEIPIKKVDGVPKSKL